MPRGQPFTVLCQLAARLGQPRVADLHLHTTASDGDFTPSQVVAHARQAHLDAVAITDHDTVAGVAEAEVAARGTGLTVIPGVEATAEFAGREFHVLGYFVRPGDPRLAEHLEAVCDRRRERFRAFLARMAEAGAVLPDGLAEADVRRSVSLGRRHLAGLLVRAGVVRSRFAAFRRFLDPAAASVPPLHRTPAAEVIRLIRGAGGVAALAHPPEETGEELLTGLRDVGLQAVEVAFPAASLGRSNRLRELAGRLGLAATGGSDCHGPEAAAGRGVGARGVTRDELAALRRLSGAPG